MLTCFINDFGMNNAYTQFLKYYTDKNTLVILISSSGQSKNIINCVNYLEKNNIGERKTNYRLKDWGISRQRYWGCPIPIAFDEDNKPVKIPTNMLPVELPKIKRFNYNGNPLDEMNE